MSANLARQGGLFGLVAALLWVVALLTRPGSADADGAGVVELAAAFATLCFVVGLVARHAHRLWPWWCVGGFALGLVLFLGDVLWDTMAPGALLMVGSVAAFLAGVLVAGVVPRVPVVLATVALGSGPALALGAVLGPVSMAWLGYAMWQERGAVGAVPPPST